MRWPERSDVDLYSGTLSNNNKSFIHPRALKDSLLPTNIAWPVGHRFRDINVSAIEHQDF